MRIGDVAPGTGIEHGPPFTILLINQRNISEALFLIPYNTFYLEVKGSREIYFIIFLIFFWELFNFILFKG